MSAPVEPGRILAGKYRVEKVLGEGGMGVVVLARDTALERRVAIKFLLPDYAEHAEAATRFMREARAAVKIQSEHIARVIDVNTLESGSPYMVMEYLEGSDLSQVIEREGAQPVDRAVAYVLQAADAIAEAHAYGIVHRDLKPANLFLANQADGSTKVKVLDFGISKDTVASTKDAALTRTSSMMGSPLYMSPEQMRSTKDVDARTDIWSLGVILYELLTARLPFDATTIPELSAKILLDEPEPMLRPQVPRELERAVLKALAKSADARYPSIAEFAQDIAPFAPKRARVNVERISKLLVTAGLSRSVVDVQESVAPPPGPGPALAATIVESKSQPRPHSGTLSEWGKTQGPAKKRGASMVLWLSSGAAVLVAGGAALLYRSAGDAKDERTEEEIASVEPHATGDLARTAHPVEPLPAPAAAAPSEAPAPSSEPSAVANLPRVPAETTSSPRPNAPKRPATKPAKPPEAPKKKPSGSQEGRFGGRK